MPRPTRPVIAAAALVGFLACIFLANAAIDRWGFVSVGFGLVAPAGVFFAGLSFQLRDVVQEHLGLAAVAFAILAGALLSMAVDPGLAVASGGAFLVSECLDLAVYTPLRHRDWTAAVLLSGIVGSIVDSVLFLWLAEATIPGPTLTVRAVAGLVLGKLLVVAVSTAVLAPGRRALALGP